MDWIDTHVHLGDEQFSLDRDEVIKRAAAAGVRQVVEIADAPAHWAPAIALARARSSSVRCSLGLHPYYADNFSQELLDKLRLKAKLPEVVAIGEIGLDYVKSQVPAAIQRRTFERLLAACKEWDMPAVIHCRGAYDDLRATLKNIFPNRPQHHQFWGVVHCFSGNAQEALDCANLGFALGSDGPITYPKNEGLREAFRQAGPSCLVLETDSPYLPPQSCRGQRNEPKSIPEIAAKMTEVLNIPLDELARLTLANTSALFRIK